MFQRFNRREEACYSNFYADDVLFVSSALPTMRGRDEIVSFYRKVWRHLNETLTTRPVEFEGGKWS